MLDPQASRFWQASLLSGLMDVDGLTACFNAIPPVKREAPEHIDRRLARQAVQSHALTLWQAQQLLAGRTTGYKVDRYVLLDLIGQGGMGRVYLARDTRLNRRVALKILAPERINNPRAIARFQREARVGAQLQHENLVRVYDFGESNGRFFLVMEFIEGKTIGTLISEQGPMPSTTAVRLVRQVAMGLGHAHRKGLIHRDVNPYNILVTHDGTAKLADLGLAIDLAEEERVTREGATVGTFDYVAPEQARHSHAADIRSDIYSLGCTLYHMLAGQVPFPSPSLPEKLFAHQALEPTPLSQLVPGLPEGLGEIVARMMRKSPDERYATPMQVAIALEPYADEYAGAGSRGDVARSFSKPEAEPTTQPDGSPTAAVASSPLGNTPSSTSPRSDEAKVVAAPRIAAESAPASLQPVVVPVGLSTPPATPPSSGSSPGSQSDAAEPAVPILTPFDEPEEQDSGVPLIVDLGPEPPLSEGISRSRSRFAALFTPGSGSVFLPGGSGSDTSTSTSDGSTWGPAPVWLWGLVALAVLAAVLVVLVGLAGALATSDHPAPNPDDQTHRDSPRERKTATGRPRPIREDEPAIVVRREGQTDDEEEIAAESLVKAMDTAMAMRGYVELRNREPLRLAADQTFDSRSRTGELILRAAPGTTPVIAIEPNRSGPLLRTGAAVSLVLSGLTIIVHSSQLGASPSSAPQPVIAAAGTTHIDRCAFQVDGSPHLKGSRALVAEGGALVVDRCWFQGFDQAIEVQACNGTVAQIQQTMIVPTPGPAPPRSPPELHGWGLKVQPMPGGASRRRTSQRRLILESCTVEGAGLLDLGSSSVELPLQVEVKSCAVRAMALVAWKPVRAGDSFTAQVQWLGEGNQLDILGPSWTVRSASLATPVLPTTVTDTVTERESSSKIVARESHPIRMKLVYRTAPTERSKALRPQDFAINPSAWAATKVGADPELVGPWSR